MTRTEIKTALMVIGFIRPATADIELDQVDEELEMRLDKTMLVNGWIVSKEGSEYEMKRI